MTNPQYIKRYKKYTKILPQQRKFLQQRQRELKEVLEMQEEGCKNFLSKELKIDELENCIKDMEEYIEEYENI